MAPPLRLKFGVTSKGPGLASFLALARAMNKDVVIRAGIVDDGKGKEASDVREGGLTNAEIGLIHEFGDEDNGIPERPFIRPTWQAKRAEWGRFFGERIGDIFRGKLSVWQAFNQTGALMASDIKDRIVGGSPIPPPNSPSVTARKEALNRTVGGVVRTLVDIGSMVGSISWRVMGLDK